MFKGLFKGMYGLDHYTLLLLILSIPLLQFDYVWVAGLILVLYAGFRSVSKNIAARENELFKFNRIAGNIFSSIRTFGFGFRGLSSRVRTKALNTSMKFKQRKDFLFLKCPKCKKQLRLPKGKGKLHVTCPVCGTEFIKKT